MHGWDHDAEHIYIYIFGNFISFFTYIISNTLFENLEGCVDIKTKDSVNINLLVKMIRRLSITTYPKWCGEITVFPHIKHCGLQQ
jgi:hypothetical protein